MRSRQPSPLCYFTFVSDTSHNNPYETVVQTPKNKYEGI